MERDRLITGQIDLWEKVANTSLQDLMETFMNTEALEDVGRTVIVGRVPRIAGM